MLLRLLLFADRSALTDATLTNGVRLFLAPDALGFAVWLCLVLLVSRIEPATGVVALADAEVGMHFPIVFRSEGFDFALALGKNRECWSLHTACGGNVEATMA